MVCALDEDDSNLLQLVISIPVAGVIGIFMTVYLILTLCNCVAKRKKKQKGW